MPALSQNATGTPSRQLRLNIAISSMESTSFARCAERKKLKVNAWARDVLARAAVAEDSRAEKRQQNLAARRGRATAAPRKPLYKPTKTVPAAMRPLLGGRKRLLKGEVAGTF